MHEFSLLTNLMRKIESIAREKQVKKVVGIKVRLGALAHISRDHFQEHFHQAAQGTVAEGARLDIVVSMNQWDPHAQEIILDSVEVEE